MPGSIGRSVGLVLVVLLRCVSFDLPFQLLSHCMQRRSGNLGALLLGAAVLVAGGCKHQPPGWPDIVDPPEGFTARITSRGQADNGCGPWALNPSPGVEDPVGRLRRWVEESAGLDSAFQLPDGGFTFEGGFEGDELGGWVPMIVTAEGDDYTVAFCDG